MQYAYIAAEFIFCAFRNRGLCNESNLFQYAAGFIFLQVKNILYL